MLTQAEQKSYEEKFKESYALFLKEIEQVTDPEHRRILEENVARLKKTYEELVEKMHRGYAL